MLEQVRSLQMGRLVELAKDLAAHPASSELAAALLAFPLNPENWDGLPLGISIEDSQAIGFALVEIGQFAEAQPWYERAVAEAEQGDVHGRIDHASLGTSLREGAKCLRRIGRMQQAQMWEERVSRLTS